MSLGGIVLAVVAFIIYGPTLRYEMIFDDILSIANNKSIHRLTPLLGTPGGYGPLKPEPATPLTARPMVSLTFAVNYYFSQLDPAGYRLTNIVAHVFVTLLLWAIVSATLRQPYFKNRFDRNHGWLAFSAALIWMVHPTHTETVVYLTQRTDLQMGLFYALTVYLSIRFWASTRWTARVAWCIAAIASSICGMLSKEMMASVPAMVMFYEWTFVGGSIWTIAKRSWLLHLGLMVSWLPLVAIYSSGAGTPLAGFHNTISATDFWLTQSNSFFVYWRLLFAPWPLLLHYHVPTLTTFSEAWPGVIAITLYALFTAYCVWRRTAIGYVLLWFFAVLSPTLIVPLPHEEIAERRLYVTLMGIIPFLSVSFFVWMRSLFGRLAVKPNANDLSLNRERASVKWLVFGISPTVVVAFALSWIGKSTLPRLEFQSGLWQHVLNHQPNNLFALASDGIEDVKKGHGATGLEKLQRAFDADPKYEFFSLSLVQTLDYMLAHERMLEICRFLDDRVPNNATHNYNLAVALEKNGLYEEAMEKYRKVTLLAPKSWEAHSALATLLAERGQVAESIQHFEFATTIHPDFMNCMNLMTVYVSDGQLDKALLTGKLLLEAARKEKSPEEVEQIQLQLQETENVLRSENKLRFP